LPTGRHYVEMRPQLVLVMTWVLAVIVASAIGFFAVGLVGDVLRDRGPLGVAPGQLPGPHTVPQPDHPPMRDRFTYPAGALTVQCTGASAVLLDSAAAPGWEVTEAEPGPDEDVDVTFRRGDEVLSIEVYCNEGQPRAVLEN
jgi:hypothetical protein